MHGAAEHPFDRTSVFEQLPDYIEQLRSDGIGVEPHQHVQLLALLARLEVEGNAPPSSSRLANLVVPILAGTPTQQAVCHERWQAMFGPGDTGPVRHIHQQSAPRDSDRATQRRWWLQSAFASIGAITGVILLVLAGVIALGSLNRLFWPPLANERQQVSPEGAAGRIPDL